MTNTVDEFNKLLGDIVELSTELVTSDVSLSDFKYLELVKEILRQIRADGSPGFPIWEHVEKIYGIDLSQRQQ